jgi:AraC family transcriptional regulator of adaptative response / DNA-3-methyladenine glycosylase II
MVIDADICYRALRARDARFDGRFFIGVKTTGIYCRPVCPARTPLRKNVTFFACAAAAESAGFRACRRCRPETSPGTPAWLGTSSTVSRALRLIHEGYLDERGAEALAARLGVGERHLRRLFDEHLGASPIEVALSRRLHLAKRLIDETALPITDIAFASGFSSVRRFNDAFTRNFRRAPREMRREEANGRARHDASKPIEARLSYRPPFDWRGLLAFFAQRALEGVEAVEGGAYVRTIRFSDATGAIHVRHEADRRQLVVEIPQHLVGFLPEITRRVRRLFDLEAEPRGIREVLGADLTLNALVRKRPGLRVPGAWDPFEIAVRAIVGQQVSVAAARTVCGRIVARYGVELDAAQRNGLRHAFPDADRLATARLNGLGLTGRRVATIRAIARGMANGSLMMGTGADLEETVARLTKLPGVGAWTAHYIALRALGEPDAFPTGDLGLIRAWEALARREVTAKQLDQLAEAWRPWRAYAALHLWTSLAKGDG